MINRSIIFLRSNILCYPEDLFMFARNGFSREHELSYGPVRPYDTTAKSNWHVLIR